MNPGSSRARASLRTQMRETARAAILDAAEELIATRGLAGAPLVQIARRAGIAVGTLYNYFTDRDAMIRALFESRRATLRPALRAAMRPREELAFEPRLRAFVHDVLAAFEAHRRFIKVAIEAEHLKPSPSTAAHDLQASIRELVEQGAREGVVAPAFADLLPVALAGALKAAVLRRIGEDAPLTGDADALVSLVLDGARA